MFEYEKPIAEFIVLVTNDKIMTLDDEWDDGWDDFESGEDW